MPARPSTPPPCRPAAPSRRAALAGAGLGALALLGGPVGSARAAVTGSPGGSTTSLPLTSTTPLRSLLSAAGGSSVVEVAVDGGSMVGVAFPAGTDVTSVDLRVRRAGAGWGDWTTLEVGDGAPDLTHPRESAGTVVATDPVWTGDLGAGAAVQVRLPAGAAGTARLEVVDPGTGVLTASTTDDLAVTTLAADVARPTIRPRADWGADESLRTAEPAYADELRAAIVHHTADGGAYSPSEVPAVIRGMYRYHTVSLGWSDLGYNVVVDRFGGIWEGRAGGVGKAVIGAHAGGFNTGTFGVSMMGDFTSVAPSDACLQSVAAVIAWKFSRAGIPAGGTVRLTSSGGGTARYPAGESVGLRTVNGHRDVGFTACPGDVGYTRMDDIRDRVRALLGSGGAPTAVSRKYAAVDGESLLGRPTSAEGDALDGGRFRHYEQGSIYDHPTAGAHVVRGTARAKYAALGWEWSFLGFPTMDTTSVGGGHATHFQGGSVYRRDGGEPFVVRGAIRATWASRGWERSRLGFPTSDEHDVAGGRRSDFTGGHITWNARTGAVTVTET